MREEKKWIPSIESKKATIRQYIGLRHCHLCKRQFLEDEVFRVVEEGGPFDNDWFGICNRCVATPDYTVFWNSNCTIPPKAVSEQSESAANSARKEKDEK